MNIKNKLTPYPILSNNNDNYMESSFYTCVDVSWQFHEIVIDFQAVLKNQEIEELLENKKAEYAVHVECPVTSFRRIYHLSNPKEKIHLSDCDVKSKVQISPFVVALTDIPHFSSHDFHADYSGINFSLEKGNILAMDVTAEYQIEMDDEPQTMQSIIKLEASKDDKQEYMDVDCDSDYILIRLPKAEHEIYCNYARSSYKTTLLSQVILPALVIALQRIQHDTLVGDADDFSSKWEKVLDVILKQNKINIEDKNLSMFLVAQQIFQNPIIRSLREIQEQVEMRNQE